MKKLTAIADRVSGGGFGLLFGLGLLTSLFLIKTLPSSGFVGGDGIWFQWSLQIQRESPFGFTQHLGWPFGFSNYDYPQIGIGVLVLASILSIFIQASSIQLILGTAILISVLNGATSVMLAKIVYPNVRNIEINVLAFLATVNPFVLQKISLGHLHIGYFAPLVAGLALYLKFSSDKTKEKLNTKENIFLCLIILSSPPWWSFVIVLIFFVTIVLISISSGRKNLTSAVKVMVISIFSFLLPLIPSLAKNLPVGNFRSPWDSNTYGGHLIDFLYGSPLFTYLFPERKNLILPGVSLEQSPIGTVLGIAVLLCICNELLKARDRNKNRNLEPISSSYSELSFLFLILMLCFLVGGIGNLQAGGFAFLELTSPGRVWARLSIVLGVVGFILLIKYIEKTKWRLLVLVTAMVIGTFEGVQTVPQITHDLTLEKSVIKVIENRTEENCPILQLPFNTFPNGVFANEGNPEATYYSGGVFYTLDPDKKWTFGSWEGSESWNFNLKETEKLLLSNGLTKDTPYCAAIVDKLLMKSRPTEGRADFELAKLYQLESETIFENRRYKLVLLN